MKIYGFNGKLTSAKVKKAINIHVGDRVMVVASLTGLWGECTITQIKARGIVVRWHTVGEYQYIEWVLWMALTRMN